MEAFFANPCMRHSQRKRGGVVVFLSNILPYLVIGFIVFFAVAFIYEARRQRFAETKIYRQYAVSKGRRFAETDDGTARDMADGLEAVGVFQSPSLGRVIPQNVVTGKVPEGNLCQFKHSLRRQAGESYPFHVCIIQTVETAEYPIVLRFVRGQKHLQNPFYRGKKVPLADHFESQLVAYASDRADTVANDVETRWAALIREAESLPWRVDLQVRDRRVAVYSVERNIDKITPEALERLEDFTRTAVRRLQGRN